MVFPRRREQSLQADGDPVAAQRWCIGTVDVPGSPSAQGTASAFAHLAVLLNATMFGVEVRPALGPMASSSRLAPLRDVPVGKRPLDCAANAVGPPRSLRRMS